MGPSAVLYHCQYEKSASPATHFRPDSDPTAKPQGWTFGPAFAQPQGGTRRAAGGLALSNAAWISFAMLINGVLVGGIEASASG
jgi:hypothetical protein